MPRSSDALDHADPAAAAAAAALIRGLPRRRILLPSRRVTLLARFRRRSRLHYRSAHAILHGIGVLQPRFEVVDRGFGKLDPARRSLAAPIGVLDEPVQPFLGILAAPGERAAVAAALLEHQLNPAHELGALRIVGNAGKPKALLLLSLLLHATALLQPGDAHLLSAVRHGARLGRTA